MNSRFKNTEITNRLELTKSVSPFVIEKSIKHILNKLNLYNYPIEVNNKKSGDYSLANLLSNTEKTKLNEKIHASILRSFIFDKVKYNKYHYFSEEKEKLYKSKSPIFIFDPSNDKIIDFLNLKALNEIRFLMLDLQNRGKFKNFNENRLSNILSNNFQTLNNNAGNAIETNRNFLKKRRPIKNNRKALYYIKSQLPEKSITHIYL